MLARMRSGISGVAAIIAMVGALWIWTRATELAPLLATQPMHPQLELWAIRLCALAVAAGAQSLLMVGVVGAFYEERVADEVVRTVVGLLGSAAMVAALVLAVAGR